MNVTDIEEHLERGLREAGCSPDHDVDLAQLLDAFRLFALEPVEIDAPAEIGADAVLVEFSCQSAGFGRLTLTRDLSVTSPDYSVAGVISGSLDIGLREAAGIEPFARYNEAGWF